MLLGRCRAALSPSFSFSVFSEARLILFLIWNSPSLSRNTTGVPTSYMCTLLQLSIFFLLHVGLHSHTFNLEYSCPFSLFPQLLLSSPYSDFLDLDNDSDLERNVSGIQGAWESVLPPPSTCLSGNQRDKVQKHLESCAVEHVSFPCLWT